jgi:hypothetical protein
MAPPYFPTVLSLPHRYPTCAITALSRNRVHRRFNHAPATGRLQAETTVTLMTKIMVHVRIHSMMRLRRDHRPPT